VAAWRSMAVYTRRREGRGGEGDEGGFELASSSVMYYWLQELASSELDR
jgi:hypothetical protein